MRIKSPRMFVCLLLALCLLATVYVISPQQGPVIVYKLSIVLLAAFTAYWVDRWAFPYARPHLFVPGPEQIWNDCGVGVFAVIQIRRAIIMGCTMLAVGMGL